MSRKNDFAGEMGRGYREAMAVICPHEKVGYDLLTRQVDESRTTEVLDLGCGGGEFLKGLLTYPLSIYKFYGLDITGVDNSPLMIKRAKELLGISAETRHRRVVQSDIAKYLKAMTLVGKDSEVITSNFVLHNFTQEERAGIFPLIYEALSDMGRFLTLDKIAVTDPAEHEAMYNSQLRIIGTLAEHGMPNLVQPWLNHYAADNAPERRIIEGDLIEQLRQVGFREVRTLYRGRMEAVVEARK